MIDPSRSPVPPLGQALGRIPSGLYILTVTHAGRSTGMLASWVQQAGFDPPMLTAAIAARRYVREWVEAEGRFTLNQLAAGSKALIRHFGRGFEPDAPAFEGLELRDEPTAGPVLAAALAYLDSDVVGVFAGGDHVVFLGRVASASLLHPEAEPFVHVRQNGFHY